MSKKNQLPIVHGAYYAWHVEGIVDDPGQDSAALAEPYALKVVGRQGNAKLHTEKVSFERIGSAAPSGKGKRVPKASGTLNISAFQNGITRRLSDEEAESVRRGEPVP